MSRPGTPRGAPRASAPRPPPAAGGIGLPEALERAASALPEDADGIRPANGDPAQLGRALGAEAGARVLAWLLAHEPGAGAELADAWAEDPDAGAAALLAVSPDPLPKEARKALRRAHHRLRSRGIAVPEPRPAEVVAKLPPLEEAIHAAMVSPIDPRGARVAYLVESHPSGGARLFELMLDEARGVIEFEIFNTGRSKVREFMRHFTKREQYPAVEAPPDAVRALVARIAARQRPDRAPPRGFSEWRSRVAAPPEGAATPGELARAALGAEAGPERAERAAELIRKRELGPWPPPAELLEPVAERLRQLLESPLVASAGARRERADDILREAIPEVFAAFGAPTADRFEESAYVFWKAGRGDDACACLAAADAFRAGVTPEHPVAYAMLEVVFAPALERIEPAPEAGGAADEESLIVNPWSRAPARDVRRTE